MPPSFARACRAVLCLATLLLLAEGADAATSKKTDKAAAKPDESARRKAIAALLLRQSGFGSLSLIPVRFENSRIAGPFEDKGGDTWCVSAEMHGRTFGKPERPRAIVRQITSPEGPRLRAESYDSDVCSGNRSEPFAEFEALASEKH